MNIVKVFLAAGIISFASWLSGKKTILAGFITAMPLTTILALAFSQLQYNDDAQSFQYAKSVFAAVPLTMLFFVPFLIGERWGIGFWPCYFLGIILLVSGYFVHTYIGKVL